jgi:hypothetical protein
VSESDDDDGQKRRLLLDVRSLFEGGKGEHVTPADLGRVTRRTTKTWPSKGRTNVPSMVRGWLSFGERPTTPDRESLVGHPAGEDDPTRAR